MNKPQQLVTMLEGIEKQINSHMAKQRELQERLLAVERSTIDKDASAIAIFSSSGISNALQKSDSFHNFKERNVRNAGVTVDTAALLPAISNNTIITADPTNPPQRLPGIVGSPEKRIWLRQLLPTFQASSASFIYTRELAYTNSAAAQATEGAEKAESGITFEEVTGNISTYAHWLRMSRQIMSDNRELVDFTTSRLAYGLELNIEDALINGDGTSGTLSGLMDTGNSTVFTPTASDTAVDSLRKAKLALENANFQAGLIVLNPSDLSAIELLKDTDDNYIVGRPIQGGLATLWGTQVYTSTAVTAGQFAALDTQQAVSLHQREKTLIEFSDSDDDNFTKNLVTVRAECRLGFGVHLPAGVITGNLTT